MDFLTQSNRRVAGEEISGKPIDAKGKNVLVIGGGDTGSDCVGTANRQGAARVFQFEIMPKPPLWNEPYNPSWPAWPNILRTSSSHLEGCERDWSIVTRRFSGRGNTVREGLFARAAWQADAKTGKQKMVEIPGSDFSVTIDLVLLAMGFLHVTHNRLSGELGVELDERGNIKCNKSYASTVDGVFVAGDAGTGASLVVRAIYHGREAGKMISEYLK